MDNMFNKAYEISLWEDYIVYRRQRLVPVQLNEKIYTPGSFYSQNLHELGSNYGDSSIPYTIDYLPYNENKIYYSSDNKIFIEGESLEDLTIEMNDTDWYENGEMVPNTIVQFYQERELCIIGSNSMNTPIRAYNGKLVVSTNGSSTLTFSMQYKYYDIERGTLVDNPFIELLVNERKIKLRHGELGAKDTKWYDFVIKNIQENSENKTFEYTAKDLFINELSKSGFGIVLNAELENNMGTVVQLGQKVLEGSDWKIPEGYDLLLRQTKEEPLYEIYLKEDLTTFSPMVEGEGYETVSEIKAGEKIYGFYTPVVNQDPFFQFLYVPNDAYQIDEDNVIINSPNYCLNNVEYDSETGMPTFSLGKAQITLIYRGERIVRQPATKFDPILNRYVGIFKDLEQSTSDNEVLVHGYSEDEYVSSVAVNNYVTNSRDFDSTTGWKAGGAEENEQVVMPNLTLVTLPDVFNNTILDESLDINYKSFLGVKFTNLNQSLYNSGISDFRQTLNGFVQGSRFVMRMKYGIPNESATDLNPQTNLFKARILAYNLNNGVYVPVKDEDTNKEKVFFNFSFIREYDEITGEPTGYVVSYADCLLPLTYSEMSLLQLGLFIYPVTEKALNTQYLFEDVQFFPYTTDMDDFLIIPDSAPKAGVKKRYFFYSPSLDYKTEEDIKYIYNGIGPAFFNDEPRFIEVYNDSGGYNKIRSITASESNRFNLIQDLCELFECWPKFDIQHNELTGEILLGRDIFENCPEGEKYRQQKYITFHEYLGNQNDIGFRYGINLKAIRRTLESEAIVSKMVVKSNQNEHGKDGYCTIERASENPTGESVIYDFGYYINQGMLDKTALNGDLYLDNGGYLGYYKKLKHWNKSRDKLIIEQSELETAISHLEANYTTWFTAYQKAEEQLAEKKGELVKLTGFTFEEIIAGNEANEEVQLWKESDSIKSLCTVIASLINKSTQYRIWAEGRVDEENSENNIIGAKQKLEEAKDRVEKIKNELKTIKESKLALEIQFYKKYSRFIQEGSWINENYIDDNLYYLDATSTLHTSSQPKVSYTINVLELSRIPGYESYIFTIGDKTFIEDTEFFGWKIIDGVQTPRKEEIIVNEITIALDSPEQNQIKVQNYKTQFEDLFQRITATTQAVEYSTGMYDKVSTIIQPDGTILPSTLQNSMANNAFVLQNVRDQSVVWDDQGITTTSLSNPNEVVRIVSGGIFLSKDGGNTWVTGITGNGINANYITTGQLDTSLIKIMASGFESFRWDIKGLTAYQFSWDNQAKKATNFNPNNFVRMDQYGIYGIRGNHSFDPTIADESDSAIGIDKIKKYANFSLTWDGFQLKNSYKDGGYVAIDSEEDFIVHDGNNVRIKIGNLETEGRLRYGIRIADANGNSVMETDELGRLWLKDELHIGNEDTSTVKIGYLDETRKGTEIHEVIHAGDEDTEFIVYEDGTIKATGGQIGSMTIGQVEAGIESSKKVKIVAIQGTTFQIDANDEVYPNKMDFRIAESNIIINSTNDIIWEISASYESNVWKEIGREVQISIPYQDIEFQNNSAFLRVTALSSENKTYSDFIAIHRVSDGKHPIILTISSNSGNMYINGSIKAELKVTVWRNNQDITSSYSNDSFVWTKYNKDGVKDLTWTDIGQVIYIDHTEVEQKATFSCELIQD